MQTSKQQKKQLLSRWSVHKENISYQCIDTPDKFMNKLAFKGSVYYADLGENIGNEINKNRTVLVVSGDEFNKKKTGLVTIVPITENQQVMPGSKPPRPKVRSHFFLNRQKYPFLKYDSAVKSEQIRTISRARLHSHIGDIDNNDMQKINEKIKNVLDL